MNLSFRGPLSAFVLVAAAGVLAACSSGGQQVMPGPSGATTSATTSAGVPPQSAARSTSDRRSDAGGNAGDNDDNGGKTVYNSIPKRVGPISSLGFECCQVREFGDGLNLTHTGRLDSVSIVMDTWSCQTGNASTNNCVSAPNATFAQPLTVNVYAASGSGPASTVGALLTTQTHTFAIPFRPSANHTRCTGAQAGEFFSDVGQTCANGLANVVTFDLSSAHVTLPGKIVVSVAFNTSTGGYHPIGTATACFTSAGGCPYDSLNVGASGNGGPIGSVLDPNGVFISYLTAASYCDPTLGAGFRLDTSPTSCGWAGFHPQIRVGINGNDGNDGNGRGDGNGGHEGHDGHD